MQNINRKIGIIGAMPEETKDIIALLENRKKLQIGIRNYYLGAINKIEAAVVMSRIGKVSAAAAAATLIHRFNVSEIIFTGCAGALNPSVKIGDVVIGRRFIQHDIDEAMLLPREGNIPMLGGIFLEADAKQIKTAASAINKMLEDKSIFAADNFKKLNIKFPSLFIGDIASGDIFVCKDEQKRALSSKLPSVLCVEMEGASVAQVCYEHNMPFTVIRVISDSADNKSIIDFDGFAKNILNIYSANIIKNLFDIYTR
ncbi:MAG: 5'-methylthioadenosine/adenosylhomocysteine nucleosidase [Elusimicrobiota bacterium]|jgi:adenosylhomocysteine nucleosidase|nr:5'-methylthioadenosine/adenosylhomocysteine nucleosidase [Elusimicrobiota bacterium]